MVVVKPPRHKVIQAIINVFDWYPSHYSPLERKLLRKLDSSLLVFASLSFFCKYLDQSNITNSYVSGMREDVGLTGNALNRIVMFWTLFYVVGQIPMIMLQSRPKLAAWFLPTLEVSWAIITFAQSRVTKPWHVYVLRSLLGFMEAPSFGATHFLLGSWYKDEELFKRAGTWFMGNALGSMVSGYLQAGAYKGLDGVQGLAGWRWLFVIDGVITLPIAAIGYAFFPGLPSSKRPWYMSPEEHQLASDRLPKHQETKAKRLQLSVVTDTIKKPIFWIAVWIYIFLIQAHYWTGYMSLWLKSEPTKWSIPQINTLPTIINIISAFSSWFGTSLAGTLSVWKCFSIPQACLIFSLTVLTVWNVPQGLKFAAFYIGGFSGATSPILYSWLNTQMRDAPESRAFTIGSMMTLGYAGQIWVPLLTFPTVQAPSFPKGYPSSLAFLIAMWGLFLYGFFYMRRSNAVKNDEETTSRDETEDVTPISGSPDLSKEIDLLEKNPATTYVVAKRE